MEDEATDEKREWKREKRENLADSDNGEKEKVMETPCWDSLQRMRDLSEKRRSKERLENRSWKDGLENKSWKDGLENRSWKDGLETRSWKDGLENRSSKDGLERSSRERFERRSCKTGDKRGRSRIESYNEERDQVLMGVKVYKSLFISV